MREAAGDVAGLVEPGQGVGRQADIEAAKVVGELLRGPRAEDRDDAGLGAQPGQGDDRRTEPQVACDVGDGLAPQPQSSPKVMVPSATSLTRRPEWPSSV